MGREEKLQEAIEAAKPHLAQITRTTRVSEASSHLEAALRELMQFSGRLRKAELLDILNEHVSDPAGITKSMLEACAQRIGFRTAAMPIAERGAPPRFSDVKRIEDAIFARGIYEKERLALLAGGENRNPLMRLGRVLRILDEKHRDDPGKLAVIRAIRSARVDGVAGPKPARPSMPLRARPRK